MIVGTYDLTTEGFRVSRITWQGCGGHVVELSQGVAGGPNQVLSIQQPPETLIVEGTVRGTSRADLEARVDRILRGINPYAIAPRAITLTGHPASGFRGVLAPETTRIAPVKNVNRFVTQLTFVFVGRYPWATDSLAIGTAGFVVGGLP